jgi:hypothetical protein
MFCGKIEAVAAFLLQYFMKPVLNISICQNEILIHGLQHKII